MNGRISGSREIMKCRDHLIFFSSSVSLVELEQGRERGDMDYLVYVRHFAYVISFDHEVDITVIPILQRRKLKYGEIM